MLRRLAAGQGRDKQQDDKLMKLDNGGEGDTSRKKKKSMAPGSFKEQVFAMSSENKENRDSWQSGNRQLSSDAGAVYWREHK